MQECHSFDLPHALTDSILPRNEAKVKLANETSDHFHIPGLHTYFPTRILLLLIPHAKDGFKLQAKFQRKVWNTTSTTAEQIKQDNLQQLLCRYLPLCARNQSLVSELYE